MIVGQTFHGTLAEAPVDKTPQKQQANVAPGAEASLALLRERAPKVPFPVMVPTVLERSSLDRPRAADAACTGSTRTASTRRSG